MGNHEVGRAMASAAVAFLEAWDDDNIGEPTKEKAIKVLDAAAKRYRGADAEFDDELSEWTPLSRLIAIAFDATPEEIASLKGEAGEEDGEHGMKWYEGPETRFRQRYEFC